MRDDENRGLPVARIEPRGVADRMVIVRAHAARRAAQGGRVLVAAAKVAGVTAIVAAIAVGIGASRQSTFHFDMPKIQPIKLDHEALDRQLMIDLAALPKYQPPTLAVPKLEAPELRDPFEPPAKLQAKLKPPRAKRQARP